MRIHVVAVAIAIMFAGCKSGIIPESRPQGPRAKVIDLVPITDDLSDYKLVEIVHARNVSGIQLNEDFLKGISVRTAGTLAALWLFEVVTPVEHAETGRELAPTLLVRIDITGVSDSGKIGPLSSGCHVTARVRFVEKKSGRLLGIYQLQAPAKGDPPFGEGNADAFGRFAMSICNILEDRASRAADKRWGG